MTRLKVSVYACWDTFVVYISKLLQFLCSGLKGARRTGTEPVKHDKDDVSFENDCFRLDWLLKKLPFLHYNLCLSSCFNVILCLIYCTIIVNVFIVSVFSEVSVFNLKDQMLLFLL